MAVSASGIFVVTLVDVFDASQLAINLDLDTHKGALFSNSITPNFDSDTIYGSAPYNANEVSGTNWASGGVVLTGTTFTGSSGTVTFDATDVSVATTTLTNARCYMLYADALGDQCIVLINFGADYSTVAGTFAITFAAGGLFNIDVTP